MKHWTTLALLGCLLVTAGNAYGANADNPTRKAWLRAGIVLDATGKLTSIEWLGTKPNDRLVTAPLEAVIRDWEFEPGKVDGVPATTETGLLVHVELRKTAEGGITLNIDDARTGALSVTQDPPAYPRDQLMRGAQARLVVQVQIDAAGKFASASMTEYEASTKAANTRKDFEAAVMKVLGSWTYRTEQVAGQGMPATLRVPISFCLDLAWCAARPQADAKASLPSGMAMAADSVVRIRTALTT